MYDPTASKVDMVKHRVTDRAHNTRVFLPKPMAATREATLAVHMSDWERVRVSIKKDIADNDKDKQKTNLTYSQKKGLVSLVRRVKSGEVIIVETDKTGQFAILTMEEYMAAGVVHTSKDGEVTEEFVKNNQRVLNRHCSLCLKIFNVGQDWMHQARHRETKLNKSCCIPMLRLLFKDHKTRSPSPTRRVCAANSGMNVHFSDLLSTVLEPLAKTIPGSLEVISVDNFISWCEDYNEEIDNKEKKLGAAGGTTGKTEKKLEAAGGAEQTGTKSEIGAAGGSRISGAEVGAGVGRQPQINQEI